MLQVDSQTHEGTSVVKIEGRFDAFAAEQVSSTLNEVLQSGVSDIWLDLSETVFVDSTALAEMVRYMKKARGEGGDVTLWRPSDAVRVILELTSLDLAFSISTADRAPNNQRRSTN